ncbi:DUF3052 domain-containing protein [Kitasatospora misakiensis]|uniref:DUF3052 domain-containing protein n=1 Tax=Kitasatospora misakiensis TaxID=67330 RepID=A0ABW0X025_9ACTN
MTTETTIATRLGIEPGMVVLEIGFDEDVDMDLRDAVAESAGNDLVEDADEVADMALVWFREEDGDLVDALVDASTPLAAGGVIWLLTPKVGRSSYVEPSDIAESGTAAGLLRSSSLNASPDWAGTRLVLPKA